MLNEASAEYDYFAVDAPPAFDDPAEGLAFLDEMEAREIKRMEEEAREKMALDQDDPTQQSYYRREDRKTVVKTETEYVRCQLTGVRMTVIPYTTAIHLLKEEEARKRSEKKQKQKIKAAKKARKRNR